MTGLIVDRRALQPSYVPRDLVHRDGQRDTLTTALEPLLDGRAGEDTFIFGPSGSGKTTLARYVAEQLTAAGEVRYGYVNCLNNPTTTGTLAALAQDARVATRREDGTSRHYYLEALQGASGPVLAVLDEVTALPDIDVLRMLYGCAGLTLVCIGVDEDTLFADARLDSQTRSRLRTFELLRLQRYTNRELVDILEHRVVHGLDTSRIAADVVEYIAMLAAGDARVAIGLLRRAALEASHTGGDITPALVDDIRDEARDAMLRTQVESLGTHQRALYELIRAAGAEGIDASTLHARYESRVDDPHAKRARRRYLESLEEYNLITAHGEGRGRWYQLAGDS